MNQNFGSNSISIGGEKLLSNVRDNQNNNAALDSLINAIDGDNEIFTQEREKEYRQQQEENYRNNKSSIFEDISGNYQYPKFPTLKEKYREILNSIKADTELKKTFDAPGKWPIDTAEGVQKYYNEYNMAIFVHNQKTKQAKGTQHTEQQITQKLTQGKQKLLKAIQNKETIKNDPNLEEVVKELDNYLNPHFLPGITASNIEKLIGRPTDANGHLWADIKYTVDHRDTPYLNLKYTPPNGLLKNFPPDSEITTQLKSIYSFVVEEVCREDSKWKSVMDITGYIEEAQWLLHFLLQSEKGRIALETIDPIMMQRFETFVEEKKEFKEQEEQKYYPNNQNQTNKNYMIIEKLNMQNTTLSTNTIPQNIQNILNQITIQNNQWNSSISTEAYTRALIGIPTQRFRSKDAHTLESAMDTDGLHGFETLWENVKNLRIINSLSLQNLTTGLLCQLNQELNNTQNNLTTAQLTEINKHLATVTFVSKRGDKQYEKLNIEKFITLTQHRIQNMISINNNSSNNIPLNSSSPNNIPLNSSSPNNIPLNSSSPNNISTIQNNVVQAVELQPIPALNNYAKIPNSANTLNAFTSLGIGSNSDNRRIIANNGDITDTNTNLKHLKQLLEEFLHINNITTAPNEVRRFTYTVNDAQYHIDLQDNQVGTYDEANKKFIPWNVDDTNNHVYKTHFTAIQTAVNAKIFNKLSTASQWVTVQNINSQPPQNSNMNQSQPQPNPIQHNNGVNTNTQLDNLHNINTTHQTNTHKNLALLFTIYGKENADIYNENSTLGGSLSSNNQYNQYVANINNRTKDVIYQLHTAFNNLQKLPNQNTVASNIVKNAFMQYHYNGIDNIGDSEAMRIAMALKNYPQIYQSEINKILTDIGATDVFRYYNLAKLNIKPNNLHSTRNFQEHLHKTLAVVIRNENNLSNQNALANDITRIGQVLIQNSDYFFGKNTSTEAQTKARNAINTIFNFNSNNNDINTIEDLCKKITATLQMSYFGSTGVVLTGYEQSESDSNAFINIQNTNNANLQTLTALYQDNSNKQAQSSLSPNTFSVTPLNEIQNKNIIGFGNITTQQSILGEIQKKYTNEQPNNVNGGMYNSQLGGQQQSNNNALFKATTSTIQPTTNRADTTSLNYKRG